MPRSRCKPDQEHEEQQPEMADREQHGEGRGGKEPGGEPGGEESQQRRSQEDAGRDLSDDAGLAQAGGDPAHGARGRDDDDELDEEALGVEHARASL